MGVERFRMACQGVGKVGLQDFVGWVLNMGMGLPVFGDLTAMMVRPFQGADGEPQHGLFGDLTAILLSRDSPMVCDGE